MKKTDYFYLRYEILLAFIVIIQFTVVAEKSDSISNYFDKLDQQLLYKDDFEKQKQYKIQNLKSKLVKAKTAEDKYDIYTYLFNEYQAYCYDSSLVCANNMIEIATALHDPLRLADSRLVAAYSCISAGLFLEAKDLLESIDSLSLDVDREVALYSTYSKLYLDMALAIQQNPHKNMYMKKSIEYSNMIIDIKGRNTPISKLQQINIYRCREEYGKAIEATIQYLKSEKLNDRSVTLCKGGIGTFYLLSGDTVKATSYLIEAAIGDIRNVTKESSALSELATIAFRRGDIDHAYLYIKHGMNDAYFFNARHRKVEASDILPIIETSRFEIIEKQQRKLFIAFVFVTLLFLCFLCAMAFILKQMKQLKAARKLIQKQNIDLKEVNRRLKDGNKIKDEYIGYLFSLNSAFIDEFENFRKMVARKLVAKQYNELMQIVKPDSSQNKRINKFNSFDSIFLKLFPDFVENFNLLFPEKNRIIPPSASVLNTELRIFALIRLGVSDSEHIAKFLNYSVNTINTYKTKIKNRSSVPNNLFEQKIMEIESVKSDISDDYSHL